MSDEKQDERTCFNIIREGVPMFVCSECRKHSLSYDRDGNWAWGASYDFVCPKYCPHCGAKVVNPDIHDDRYFLPRPLFEDGKPIQWGDQFIGDDEKVKTLSSIHILQDDTVFLIGTSGLRDVTLLPGERIKRPPKQDTDKPKECHVTEEHTYEKTGGRNRDYEYIFSCGHKLTYNNAYPPDYCPTCGAKVVDS